MNNKEKLLLVSNILKNILDREYVSSYKLAKNDRFVRKDS